MKSPRTVAFIRQARQPFGAMQRSALRDPPRTVGVFGGTKAAKHWGSLPAKCRSKERHPFPTCDRARLNETKFRTALGGAAVSSTNSM
jgi:hypothetical protein